MRKLKATLEDPWSSGAKTGLYSDKAFRLLRAVMSDDYSRVTMKWGDGRSLTMDSHSVYDFFGLGPHIRREADFEVSMTFAAISRWDTGTCSDSHASAFCSQQQLLSELKKSKKRFATNTIVMLADLLKFPEQVPLDEEVTIQAVKTSRRELAVLGALLNETKPPYGQLGQAIAKELIGKPADLLTAQRGATVMAKLLEDTIELKRLSSMHDHDGMHRMLTTMHEAYKAQFHQSEWKAYQSILLEVTM